MLPSPESAGEEIEEGCYEDEPEEKDPVIDLSSTPLLPDCAMEDEDVAVLNVPYSTRHADDWVSAGTLDPLYEEKARKKGWRPLRYFPTWDEAETWAREFFGDRFKGRIQEAVDSGCRWWSFLIKGPRGEVVCN